MQVRAAVLAVVVAAGVLAGAGSATAATVIVTVGPGGDFSFSPSDVTINQGDTVQWVWQSNGHSTTSGSNCTANGTWDSGTRNTPATFSHTFNSSGTFPYYCNPHCALGMTGSVTVNPPTAVTFSVFAATRTPNGVLVGWRTGTELATLGFNVFREYAGKRIRVNGAPVLARSSTAGFSYAVLDRRAPRAAHHLRYRLQVLGLDGSRSWYGPVQVPERDQSRGVAAHAVHAASGRS